MRGRIAGHKNSVKPLGPAWPAVATWFSAVPVQRRLRLRRLAVSYRICARTACSSASRARAIWLVGSTFARLRYTRAACSYSPTE